MRCLLVSFALLVCASCDDKNDDAARYEDSSGQAFLLELETHTANGIISTVQTTLVHAGEDAVWLWDWAELEKEPQIIAIDSSWIPSLRSIGPAPLNTVCCSIPPANIIRPSHQETDTLLVVRNFKTSEEVHSRSFGREWFCNYFKSTRNGRYIAINLSWDFLVEYKYEDRESRVGVIDTETFQIQWADNIQCPNNLPIIESVSVSEDGRYIAAVGTNEDGWIHVADVQEKKVLWEKVPTGDEIPHGEWTVNFNDVCFSPDGKRIYVAGNMGLFCFDTQTGRILSQWQIGNRLVSVAASADGRLVAGGTNPPGDVFVFDSQTGGVLMRIGTGQHNVYGLAFSPDSTMLASEGVLHTNIKIWKMPSASGLAISETK